MVSVTVHQHVWKIMFFISKTYFQIHSKNDLQNDFEHDINSDPTIYFKYGIGNYVKTNSKNVQLVSKMISKMRSNMISKVSSEMSSTMISTRISKMLSKMIPNMISNMVQI